MAIAVDWVVKPQTKQTKQKQTLEEYIAEDMDPDREKLDLGS